MIGSIQKIIFIMVCIYIITVSNNLEAGQTIEITSDVTHNVAGNGTQPEGAYSNLYSLSNPADGNTVLIHGFTNLSYQTIFGGSTRRDNETVNANNNTVSFTGIVSQSAVYGGFAQGLNNDAFAIGNHIYILNTSIGVTWGGYTTTSYGKAVSSGNSVELTNGNILLNNPIYGGYAFSRELESISYDNTVKMSGGTVEGIYGGQSICTVDCTTTTEYNHVELSGNANVNQYVYGGYSYNVQSASTTGTVTSIDNEVIITDNVHVGDAIYGGIAESKGEADVQSLNNNVYIKDNAIIDKVIFGGYSESEGINIVSYANGNNVYLYSNVNILDNVIAGSSNSKNGNATASNNTVSIYGGNVVGYVSGGESYIGLSGTGEAKSIGNTVYIQGGTVHNNVIGGESWLDIVSATATASSNNVEITGGIILGNVIAGYSRLEPTSTNGSATGNSVTISGPADLTASVIYGGFVDSSNNYSLTAVSGTDAITGNTLNLKTKNIEVAGVYNFENLNFYLAPNTVAGDRIMLVTGEAQITSTNVGVRISGNSTPLRVGDEITLIEAATLTGAPVNNESGAQGVTLEYSFDIVVDALANKLLARVTKMVINQSTKALSEGFISGITILGQTTDLIAGQGMANAASAAKVLQGQGLGLNVFWAFSAGKMRYETGSHVDLSGFSFLLGISKRFDVSSGSLTVGPFLEYGKGSYDTYNSFLGVGDTHGDGKTHHIGGGLLGRWDLNGSEAGRFYLEASARGGKVHNEYDNNELLGSNGPFSGFESDSSYLGFHFGAGHVFDISETSALDVSARYFWTKQEGDSVRLYTGDPVEFQDVESSRLRIGTRLSFQPHKNVRPFVGLAFEHEFDGVANASSNGFEIDAPSLRGNTGIGELGLVLAPSESPAMRLELGVQGYVGKRRGVTGSLALALDF
jgi:hypothetical protein